MDLFTNFACTAGSSLFNLLPTWYTYLPKRMENGSCVPYIDNINQFWLIVAAVIQILLRVASLAAIGFIIYAGILYTTSQGSPEQTSQAKNIIVNALIGLAVAVSASFIISFIANSFT